MPLSTKDESRYPMLPSRTPEDFEEEDIEENASDISKDSATTLCEKSSRRRKHSYGASWSSTHSGLQRNSPSLPVFLTWLRWGVIVGLQSIIILLVLVRQHTGKAGGETDAVLKGKVVETGGDINGLYKTCKWRRFGVGGMGLDMLNITLVSHSYTFLKPEPEKFIPNMTTNDNRMEIRRNWDLLMPRK